MKDFDPTFDVTEVTSMQWNRTMTLDLFKRKEGEEIDAKNIPDEVLDRVKEAIRAELTRNVEDTTELEDVQLEIRTKRSPKG